eukprot:jgi/Mesvir1/20381/Mv12288-RA.1
MDGASPTAEGAEGFGGGEFNWDALGQVRQLEEQNAELASALDEKEKELSTLRQLLDTAMSGDPYSGDALNQKILELSKKNRALNLAFEKERTKANKLQAELAALQKAPTSDDQKRGGAAGDGAGAPAVDVDPNSLTAQLQAARKTANDWREKYTQVTARVMDAQSAATTLKQENAKLMRALLREVGEDAVLSKILADDGDWRGRAQQISLLKDKIKELQRQLKAGGGSGTASGAEESGSPSFDDRHRSNLERQERDRRKEFEVTKEELQSARLEVATFKGKYEAGAARIRILEHEVRSLKEKLQTLLTKAATDDKLVDALRKELDNLRKSKSSEASTPPRRPSAGRQPPDSRQPSQQGAAGVVDERMARAHFELQQRCTQQEVQLQRQEKIICALQAGAAKRPPSGGGMGQESFRALEVETQRLEELVQLLKDRLKEAQSTNEDLVAQLEHERDRTRELQQHLEQENT